MSEQIPVDLRVLGHSFKLATTLEKRADLERAAELLNEKFVFSERCEKFHGYRQAKYRRQNRKERLLRRESHLRIDATNPSDAG